MNKRTSPSAALKHESFYIHLTVFLSACALLFSIQGFAQFPFSAGSSGADEGKSITRDASNDVLVTGYFSGTADFDPSSGTTNLTSAGNLDVFVAKYSAAGALLWAIKIGSTNTDYGYGIITDSNKDVLVTGSFRGTADFDPSGATANLTATGNQDIFVAKYSSAGAYLWAKKIGGSSADYGYAIATDAGGNAYVTGYFQGTADFDPSTGTANLTSAGVQDGFVAKYNSSGAYQWAFIIGTATADYGQSITTDGGGNVLVTGVFSGTADFDPSGTTTNLVTNGLQDIFVAKYSSAGAYMMAFNIGGTDNDFAYGIATDAGNNILITGYFAQTVDFDPSGATSSMISAGGGDIYVAKYNSTGAYQWAFKVGGVGNDMGMAIACDASNNVLITGYFQGVLDFDPSAATVNVNNNGGNDLFVAKYSSAGAYLCAFNIGSTSWDCGNGIAVDANNAPLVTGFFSGTADFDPSAGTSSLTSNGTGLDLFVARFSYPCTSTSVNENDLAVTGLETYPNPSSGAVELAVTCSENSEARLWVNDLLGRTLVDNKIDFISGRNVYRMDLSLLPDGIYVVNCRTDSGSYASRKIVLQR